jgi:hypothetical protein
MSTTHGAFPDALGSASSPETSAPLFDLKETRVVMAGQDTDRAPAVQTRRGSVKTKAMTLGQRLVFPAIVAVLAVAALGCKKDKDAPTSVSLPPGGVQITADDHGFTPSSVTFKKGSPAALVFVRTTDDTCATEVVFPELNVKKDLPKGKPVTITVPTDKDQKLTFQCGMGMYKSAVVVN